MSSKRLLQIVIVIGGFVPVLAGLAGVIMGSDMVPGMGNVPVPFDSHYRYLSGLLLGIGYAAWWCVPGIENKGTYFRMLAGIVFVGGLARLTSLFVIGLPDAPMLAALVMEMVITPLLALWQYKVEKKPR